VHHSSMQHSGKADIGGPSFLCRDFGRDDGVRVRFSDDRVRADGLHRWIAFDSQSHNAGQVSAHGNGEFELLILDEIAVGNGLSAAGKDSFFRTDLIFGNAETLRCELKERLISIGRSFADVGRAATQEIEGSDPVGRLIRVTRDNRGDRIERNSQFVGHNLPVRGERGALTEVALARANQHVVVRMDFDP